MKRVSGRWLRRLGIALMSLTGVWLAALIAMATLGPGLIRGQATGWAASLGRTLSIGSVEFQPWSMAVTLQGVRLQDRDGSELFAARKVYLNATPTALLLGQWRLKSFSLDAPSLSLRRDAGGEWNLARLIKDASGSDTPSRPGSSTPLIIVDTLDIRQAAVRVTDLGAPNGQAAWRLDKLNLNLVNVSTRARDGNYALTAGMPDGTRFAWHGTLNLKPLDSFGDARIDGLPVARLWPYIGQSLKLAAPQGRLSADATYHFSIRGTTPKLTLSPLSLALNDFKAEAPGGKSTAALKSLRLEDGIMDLTKQSVFFKRARLAGGDVQATRNRQGQFDWQAALKEAPATGRPANSPGWKLRVADITVEGWHLEMTDQGFVKPLKLETGIASLSGGFQLTPEEGLGLNHVTLRLAGLSVSSAARTPWLQLDELAMSQSEIREKDHQILPGNITLNGLTVALTRHAAGLDIQDNLKRVAAPGAAPRTPPGKGWNLALPDVALADATVLFRDTTLPTPVAVRADHLSGQWLSDDDGQLAYSLVGKVGTGNFDVEGTLLPDSGKVRAVLKVNGVPLLPMAPYLLAGKPLKLGGGRLSSRLDVARDSMNRPWNVKGDASIERFSLFEHDVATPLMAWNRLQAVGLRYTEKPQQLSVKEMRLERPVARLIMEADRKLNVSRLLAGKPEASAPAPTTPGLPVLVNAVHVSGGDIQFADHSMKPAFATRIHHLRGSLSGFSNQAGHAGTVTLDGGVDKYGDVKVRGKILPTAATANTDLSLVFRNVPLSSLNPYSMNFAGWQIKDGRLGVSLHYKVQDRQLQGDNRVVIQSIKLGDEVAAPGVSRLPLRLAVAVLEDSDGRIDLNVPVRGNLDDPSFSYGHLVWQALGNVIRKVATAPFRALGALFGGEGFDAVTTVPGESAIAPPEREKIEQLAAMLSRRPQLALSLGGGFDPDADLHALARARVDRAILLASGFTPGAGEPLPLPDLSSPAMQVAVKSAFAARIGRLTLIARQVSPSSPSGMPFARLLRDEMIARETVSQAELTALANQRLDLARKLLLGKHPELAARVTFLPPSREKALDGGVPLHLGLVANSP